MTCRLATFVLLVAALVLFVAAQRLPIRTAEHQVPTADGDKDLGSAPDRSGIPGPPRVALPDPSPAVPAGEPLPKLPPVEQVDFKPSGLKGVTTSMAFLSGYTGETPEDREFHLLQSCDGGSTWSRCPVEIPWGSDITSLQFVSPHAGWIVTVHTIESVSGPTGIWRTTDDGRSWTPCSLLPGYYGGALTEPEVVAFMDENHGWIAVHNYSRTTEDGMETMQIYETRDGGRIWTPLHDGAYDPEQRLFREVRSQAAAAPSLTDSSWRLVEVEPNIRWRVERIQGPNARWLGVREFQRIDK